jgi:hypothetical protein
MFADDPPNAVIVHHDPKSAERAEFVFEMTAPSYDATTGILAFQAAMLDGQDVLIEGLHQISLFIDPSFGQWVSIVWHCSAAVANMIGAVVVPEAAVLEIAAAYGLSCGCCKAIAGGFNLNYPCYGCP